MAKNSDQNNITIELPENLQDVSNDNKPLKKRPRTLLRLIFIGIIVLLFVCTASFTYLKLKYNDRYLKEQIVNVFEEYGGIQITIGSLETNWINQSVFIKDVSFKPINTQTEKDIFYIGSLSAQLHLYETIADKSLNADVVIDSLDLNVRRYRIKDNNTGKERYSTNISEVLNNLVEMPWKEWLNDINWRTASGKILLSNSSITAHDDVGVLKECSLSDIKVLFSRVKEDIAGEISMSGFTPNSNSGTLNLDIKAVLSKIDAKSNNSTLDFLQNINISGKVDDFDAPYMLGYFGWNKVTLRNTTVELTSPLTLDLEVASETMNNVAVSMQLTTKSIGKIIHNNKSLLDTPSASIKVNCNLDFDDTWTEIKPLDIELDLGNNSQNLINITAQVNGNFGEEFVITMNASTDLTAFSKSPLGRHLNSNIFGKINHSFAGNWKRNGVWKGNYTVNGDKITSVIEGKTISLPLQGNVDLLVSKSKLLTPLNGQLNFSLESPSFKLKSLQPLFINFEDLTSRLATDIEFSIDFAKLYSHFESFFKDLGLEKIDEIIKGTIKADSSGKINYNVISTSTLAAYKSNVVNISGQIDNYSKNNYGIKMALSDKDNDVKIKAEGELKKENNLWQVNLTQSGIVDIQPLKTLYNRFRNIFKLKELPFDVAGTVREAINANISYGNIDDINLALSFSTSAENIKTIIRGQQLDEKKVGLNSSLRLRKSENDLLLTLEHLDFKSRGSKILLKTGEYNLSILKSTPWRDALRALPPISGEISVDKGDMETIGKIIKNKIAILYFLNASVEGKFLTKGGAKAELSVFKYTSNLINVESHKNFTIEPIVMTDRIIAKKWFAIQDSLSDVDLSISADLFEWKSFVPRVAVDVMGRFVANAVYSHAEDKLFVRKFETEKAHRDDLLIPSIKFNGTVVDFFKTISHFRWADFMNSIDTKLHIDVAELSTAKIKQLAGENPGEIISALSDKNLEMSNLEILHKLGASLLSITGSVSSKILYYSHSDLQPTLAIDGTVSTYNTPLLFKFNDNSIAAKGVLDLTASDIAFNALSPYKYVKPLSMPQKLEFVAGIGSNNISTIKSASIVGGPLAVSLNDFSYEGIGDKFKLLLKSLHLDGSFTVSIDDLILDSVEDRVKAKVNLAPINLSQIQQSIGYHFPISVSGTLGSAKINLDDSYNKYFETSSLPRNNARLPNNFAEIGPTSITIASSDLSSDKSITMAFSQGKGDSSIESISLSGVTIDNPKGYSDVKAVEAGSVLIKPEFSTLFTNNIIIDRIDIQNMQAYYEVALKKSNIDALKEDVASIFASGSSGEAGGKKTLIKNLYVTDGTVRVSSLLFRGSASLALPLNLHLENIGGDSAGETFASGFGKIFSGIGKVGLGLAGGVGGVIGGVGQVGKSIITAPLKLFKDIDKEQEQVDEN